MIFWIVGGVGLALLLASVLLDDFLTAVDFGPEWLSGAAVGGFLAAFGFVGGLVTGATSSPGIGTAAGLGAGVALGAAAGGLTRSLARGDAGAAFTPADYIGVTGVVVTPIGDGAAGEVVLTVAGQPVKVNARADQPVPLNTPVRVVSAVSATNVTVAPAPRTESSA